MTVLSKEIKPNEYHDSKIYKIVSKNTDKIYIGSTKKTLDERLKKHERNYKSFKNGKYNNVTSFNILELGDYDIILIANVSVENKTELLKIEGGYIMNEINVVNKFVAGRTKKEYNHQRYEKNKDKMNEITQQYKNENKDKINELNQQYRNKNKDKINEKFTCDCGGKYTNANCARHLKSKKHLGLTVTF